METLPPLTADEDQLAHQIYHGCCALCYSSPEKIRTIPDENLRLLLRLLDGGYPAEHALITKQNVHGIAMVEAARRWMMGGGE